MQVRVGALHDRGRDRSGDHEGTEGISALLLVRRTRRANAATAAANHVTAVASIRIGHPAKRETDQARELDVARSESARHGDCDHEVPAGERGRAERGAHQVGRIARADCGHGQQAATATARIKDVGSLRSRTSMIASGIPAATRAASGRPDRLR